MLHADLMRGRWSLIMLQSWSEDPYSKAVFRIGWLALTRAAWLCACMQPRSDQLPQPGGVRAPATYARQPDRPDLALPMSLAAAAATADRDHFADQVKTRKRRIDWSAGAYGRAHFTTTCPSLPMPLLFSFHCYQH